jgi:acyl-CoA reductase-like NAD-dependent aldehyde dehydrogenase
LLEARAEIIEIVREEIGKVAAEGLFNEALGPLDTVNGWARVVERSVRRRNVRLNPLSFPRKTAHVDLLPRGVVGIIAPWNYPVAGLYRSTIPALLTGNGIVVKPSEYTPRSSGWFLDRLAAGLPEGLVSTVHGDGRVGAMLIDAGIDACVFTGSTHSGRDVRLRCADRGIPSSIEMGGKDAAIVLADCDLPRAVTALTHWTLSNVGQACGAVEIVYVDERIADELVERLRRAWERLNVGANPEADVGPLGNERQLDVVVQQVADARDKGARVVCGGSRIGESLCFAPTILDHCHDRMAVVEEETFGPVLAVVRVEGAAEAIRRVNGSRYGLGASIWTRDLERARRLAGRLDVGVVTINGHAFSGAIPALPWSGTRATGFGIANGPESLATFVRPRATIIDASNGPEPFFLPYDQALSELGELLAEAQLGRFGRAWKIPLLLHERLRAVRRAFR